MKGAVLLLCFVAAVFGQCSYYTWDASTSNSYNYDLSALSVAASSYAYSYSDFNSSKYWIWNVCGNLDSAWNPYTYSKVDCQDDAVACFQYSWDSYSTYYSVGTYSSAVFSDSMYGASQGVSISYSSGYSCGYSYRTSRFEFVCDYSYYYPTVTSVESNYCSDVITVHASQACPVSSTGSVGTGVGTGATGVIADGGTYDNHHHGHSTKKTTSVGAIIGMAIGSFVGTAILCTICVCCCVRRQARCQQRKQQCQEMKNVSYSPVPQQPQPQQQQVQQPFVHPQFVAPQQYPVTAGSQQQQQQQQMSYPYPQYYFYVQPQAQPQPAKPQQTAEPAPLVKLDVDSDEQLAKKLQAEFDSEAHN